MGESLNRYGSTAPLTCQFEGCGKPQGKVGLEGEGYRIEFRNLKSQAASLTFFWRRQRRQFIPAWGNAPGKVQKKARMSANGAIR